MTVFEKTLHLLHGGHNPYLGFPASEWGGAWYGDPGATRDIFKSAIDKAKPGIVLEIGSFVGESAVFMGRYIRDRRMDAAIICLDTWYGGIDHYLRAPEKIRRHFGRPDLYYRFVANVIANGFEGMVIPLPLDSGNGLRLLKELSIRPDMIYVDASHEENDALSDMELSWGLLKDGGVMLVDDLSGHFPGVLEAWDRFKKGHSFRAEAYAGEKGMVVK